MKKALIGLLFVWIIIFSFIGYTQIIHYNDGETVEHDSEEQTIIRPLG